jgi:cell division protein FtsW (lipid II flippase)
MTPYAALLFSLVSGAVAIFQLALVLGAPWGELTMGGRWRGRLPPKVRLIAGFSMLLLCCFSVIIFARSNYGVPLFESHARQLAWVVVGYCAIGSLANIFTPSKRERQLWLPVLLVMLASSSVVATS